MEETRPIQTALISVFDKAGLQDLCESLHRHGVRVYSTGGTFDFISKQTKIEPLAVDSLTQFPEMMDGRVKTLHPKIFGGVLARRRHKKDLEEAEQFGIPLFDLVVVNLYPFWNYLGKPWTEQAPNIDIGGPSLLRAASKNFEAVVALSSPQNYGEFLVEMDRHSGKTTLAFRKKMAAATFARTSEYDGQIAGEWTEKSDRTFPSALQLGEGHSLRYGENPHQKAAWFTQNHSWKCLQGKELSYNNLLDSEAAYRLARDFKENSVVIVKHNNPCGVAVGSSTTLADLFGKALTCDSQSAFGGIVACNRAIDAATATEMAKIFLEVVIAPAYSPEALTIFSQKKNLRVIEWAKPTISDFEIRQGMGGWLVQSTDHRTWPETVRLVTEQAPEKVSEDDLKLAWITCKHVRSNAIVLAKMGKTIGIGAGQMSRVDAVHVALEKAGTEVSGSVLASDAFFPFRDNIDLLKGLGIKAIIQPGGSQRDQEVIDACNEQGIAMVFTGERHFRH